MSAATDTPRAATRASRHPVDEVLPVPRLAVYGFQHVLAFYAGAVIVPVHRAEYQSNGMPRPGELSVQRKSMRGSVRVRRGVPANWLLSKYSPASPRAAAPFAPVDDSAALWEQGMLVARDQPLAEVLAELARYRHGLLRCDPEVAGLHVSGALSVADTDQALNALELTLPVRVSRLSRYWVTVSAR